MQWLIDLVIEAIGIPPTFIDRGPFQGDDFDQGDLTQDDNFHDLDLSGIIPAGATAALIHLRGSHDGVDKYIMLKPYGSATNQGHCSLRTQVSGVSLANHRAIALGPERIIEYKISDPAWNILRIGVKGWWL